MPSYDEDRRELFSLLEPSLGSRGAALLMDHLPPAGWADLATKADLSELRAELIERLAEAQTRIQTTMIQTMFGAVIAVSGLVFAVASFAR